jgi:hypothetical protein
VQEQREEYRREKHKSGKKEGDGFVSFERLDAADEIRREM